MSTNYRTVYIVNPSKRNFDGMVDGITYRIPAKGFSAMVHFIAKHIKGQNESLEEYESIIDVIARVKELGTYEIYFEARKNDTAPAEVSEEEIDEVVPE